MPSRGPECDKHVCSMTRGSGAVGEETDGEYYTCVYYMMGPARFCLVAKYLSHIYKYPT